MSLAKLSIPTNVAAEEPVSDGPWDLSWLDGLKGKHKQVFDVSTIDGALLIVTNYYDAFEEVLGVRHPKVNAVIGIARSAYPINAVDAVWAKYELGRRWNVMDPETKTFATRNIFMDRAPAPAGKVVGVRPLQTRGAIFWQCNNALNRIVDIFSSELSLDRTKVREELVAGLNPGVKLIPAHTMFLGLAQERGCAYEKV